MPLLRPLLLAFALSTTGCQAGLLSPEAPSDLEPLGSPHGTAAPKHSSNATPMPTPTAGVDAERQAIVDRVLQLCNVERANVGATPLAASATLDQTATFRSEDMATRHYFSHTDPDGHNPFWHLTQGGITYRTAGENIACGQSTPEAVMASWMGSPGHRRNILKAAFGKLGVGFARNSQGIPYWTQLFTD